MAIATEAGQDLVFEFIGGAMSEPTPQEPNKAAKQSPDEANFNLLLFRQELNEVYLLLDFISGRPDKHLSDLKGKIPKLEETGSAGETMSQDDIIRFVSKLRYPPEGDAVQTSRDAALLLLIKDTLNSIAYPARGMTIAYTTLFTNADRSSAASRPALASRAYPTLTNHAKWFRGLNHFFVFLGVAITLLSAILLWKVTYGVQLTARFEEAKRNDTLSAARVFDQINSLKVSGAAPSTYDITEVCSLRGHRNAKIAPEAAGSQQKFAIESSGSNVAAAGAPTLSIDMREVSAVQQACADYAFKHAQLCVTVADFGKYAGSQTFKIIAMLLPVHELERAEECDVYFQGERVPRTQPASSGGGDGTISKAADHAGNDNMGGSNPGTSQLNAEKGTRFERMGRQEDAISIAGVLSVTSNYLLPILFGLAGSIVAVIRSIQNKIYDNVLVPRDRALAMIRLPLGMVAGICVGLFLSPDGVSKSSSGIGGFTLSASGIAFLAGYGAEAFFRTLDALVERVFVLDDPAKRKS